MAKLVPMINALVNPPQKRAKPKPKPKAKHAQQHGEMASAPAPRPVTAPRPAGDRHEMKMHAKDSMRNATRQWITGHISTDEHAAVHARSKHVLAGKNPHDFTGKSGEHKIRGLR